MGYLIDFGFALLLIGIGVWGGYLFWGGGYSEALKIGYAKGWLDRDGHEKP